MTQAASVHSTPRTDSSLFRLSERELTPKDVLADLFGEELHPDPEHFASVVIQRLKDAGFAIVPEQPKPPHTP
jgi:hypothetical protein